ncbi:MAG: N-acyl-D-amino-acid deacylase family protein [Gemmatimonadota bacterium]
MRKVFRFQLSALVAIVVSACEPVPGASDPGTWDVLLLNGRVVDGTGSAWFAGDVAISGDRITRITPAGVMANDSAVLRVDASGLVIAPGFIDIQSHSRDQFLVGDGRVVSKVTQGITTEIMGEGWTNAPANDATISSMSAIDPGQQPDSLARRFTGPRGFGAWLEVMEARGVSPNIGSFVGATTIRVYAKGNAEGPATAAELDTMRAVTLNAMQDGAFGVASALIYPPGNFASTSELVEIAKAMAPFGGVYISHMRSEADGFLEAIDELLRIGREGGVATEIYHLKAGGVRNWPKAALAVAKIDSARAAGQDVQANMYPYIAGGTGLAACTPPWASADNKLLDNLRDPATRARIVSEMRSDRTPWENLCLLATPQGVMTAGYTRDDLKKYEGQRLSAIAADMGSHWADAVVDLLLQTEAEVGMLVFMMSEPNVEMQMRQPWIKFGTDAGGFDPDSARGLTHPRAYGTFPRIFGHYVRDRGVMSLEEAVRKASAAVATRLSINDRGVLREGLLADVVVFDPSTIADRATFTEPHRLSTGVRHVFVNGVQVVRDGVHTGAKPGRIVRGPGWTGW